ncbi:sensor histidine kinase [Magnetococcus sp. PR-3]|uniref:sensor histidine kinase n=1 Tax=Magnetococcus sp. PR-3 TaxID=3120355 RepID=UPI002FCE1D57
MISFKPYIPKLLHHQPATSLLMALLLVMITQGTLATMGWRMTAHNAPLIDASMEIKFELTRFHLWFEEIIQRDHSMTEAQVWQHLKEADWYANAMLEGGENHEGRFIALKNPHLREVLTQLRLTMDSLQQVAKQRLVTSQNSGAGTAKDQHFDLLFQKALAQADLIETNIQQRIKRELDHYLATALILTFSFLLLTYFVWKLLKRHEAKNQQTQEILEQANQAKDQFMAVVSHELRTPLNAIVGMSQVLLEEAHDPDQQRQLAIVEKAGAHLTRLMDDLLDLAAINAGKLSMESEHIALQPFLDEIMGLFIQQAHQKKLMIQLELDPKLPRHIEVPATRLRQILINLLNNAIKFTDHGLISLSLSTAHYHSQVHIEVKDTGQGISEAALQQILEPFFQVDSSDTRQQGGVGLGLAICRALVEAMGGRIHVSSQVGLGSRFWFIIPYINQDKPQQQGERDKLVNTASLPPKMVRMD